MCNLAKSKLQYLICCIINSLEFMNFTETNMFAFQGKRIVEMKKERPSWFSKNLLQKTTAQPSTSKDVKPTELA